MADQSREFDVIIFGATGFVGELTADYLARNAPLGTRIALAGRSEAKLAAVRDRLPEAAQRWPLIVAEADSPSSLDAMVARTRVIATTMKITVRTPPSGLRRPSPADRRRARVR